MREYLVVFAFIFFIGSLIWSALDALSISTKSKK